MDAVPVPDSSGPRWQIPRLRRDDAWVGGVSGAIGRELGIPTVWVRIAWVALAFVGGWGVVAYLVTWAVLAWVQPDSLGDVHPSVPKGRDEVRRALGFAAVVVGVGLLFSALPRLSLGGTIALIVTGSGLALARRGLTAQLGGWRSFGVVVAGLAVAGVGMMIGAVILFGYGRPILVVGLAVALTLVIVVASAPLWWGFVRRLDRERQARVRADERAAVAAHLHDSVLQTLTLIQNSAGDAAVMTRLARRQERELRNWLDPRRASRMGSSVKGQLDDLASDIEDLYEVRVELVVSGDAIVDEPIAGLLAATREAVVNAAKHAAVDSVDVFVEVAERSVEAFVRDRGIGFEPGTITERIGIRDSIRGRIERLGGTVTIESQPQIGTEVEIRVPRDQPK